MYDGDSFFTLGIGGQIGLVIVTIILSIATIMLTHRVAIMIRWKVWAVVSALTLFWLFVWLSPQVYYLYYQMIFTGLPWQVVVSWPPPAGETLVDMILFRGEATLSNHGKGALFWIMAATAFMAGVDGEDEAAG
ncbi:MAG: hypothetical protein ACPGFA_01750 [Pikeienuella sp.]